MKFLVDRDTFFEQLGLVGRALSVRGPNLILAGILLRAEEGKLELSATDMELSVRVRISDETQIVIAKDKTAAALVLEEEGKVLVPGKLLQDVVKALPAGMMSVEYGTDNKSSLDVRSGKAEFQIRTMEAEEFPALPTADADPVFLSASALIGTADHVVRSASRDETRPILTGVSVSAENDALTMVATDSYRLSIKRSELAEKVADNWAAIIPARSLQELSKALAGTDEEAVQIALDSNRAVFKTDAFELSTRLVEGTFPNYKQLVPDSAEHEILLAKESFLEVVSRMSLLAQRSAPLKLSFEDNELTVSATTDELGRAKESLPCNYQGEEALEIGFNPQYLKEGVESVDTDQFILRLIDANKPGIIMPSVGENFIYLIMPVRLSV